MEFFRRQLIYSSRNSKNLIQHKVLHLLRKPFSRNIVTVASGTAIAQVIGILFSPVITRIYGPEAFGVLGVFISLTGILIPIVALTFPMAIVLPKSDSDAKGLVRLSIYVGVTISLLIALVLGLFGKEILSIFNMEVIIPFIIFIPFLLFFSVGRQVAEQWVMRNKQFKVNARVSIIQSLILNSSKVRVGLYSPKAVMLILLTTVGQALNVIMLAFGSKKESLKNTNENSTVSDKVSLKTLVKEYKDFPVYRAPQMFISTMTQSLPVLILSTFFGPAAAGFYAIGKRVLSMPAQIIGNAAGNVFYPRIASAANNKEKLLPGKFLEYLLFDKPIISLIDGNLKNSEITTIIKNSNLGIAYEEITSRSDEKLLYEYLYSEYILYREGLEPVSNPTIETISAYDYRNLVGQLKEIL